MFLFYTISKTIQMLVTDVPNYGPREIHHEPKLNLQRTNFWRTPRSFPRSTEPRAFAVIGKFCHSDQIRYKVTRQGQNDKSSENLQICFFSALEFFHAHNRYLQTRLLKTWQNCTNCPGYNSFNTIYNRTGMKSHFCWGVIAKWTTN